MLLPETHPLLLPEILFVLSHYVDQLDILDCSFVCKTWYDAFNPRVWHTLTVNSPNRSSPVSTQAIKSNVHHIRKVAYLRILSPEFWLIRYPRLEALKVVEDESIVTTSSVRNREIAHFIDINNRTLVAIQLSASVTKKLPVDIWNSIEGSLCVKVLRLDNIIIDASQTVDFWNACTVLEKLELNHCAVIDPWGEIGIDTDLMPGSFPLIQEIKFTNLEEIGELEQLCLAAMCPNLRSLSWSGVIFPLRVISDTCPIFNIDSLEAKGENMTGSIDYFLYCNRKPIKRLSISGSSFDTFGDFRSSFGKFHKDIQEYHFLALQELDLTWHPYVSSATIARLLRECPLLTSFKAGAFSPDHLSRENICASADRLLTLHIYFSVRCRVDTIRAIEFLARLAALQELNLTKCRSLVSTGSEDQSEIRSLQLSLDLGLDQLSGLKNMRRLYFGKHGQEMTMKDAMWMKEHWMRLEVVQGRFHENEEMNAEIQELFRSENERFLRRQRRESDWLYVV